MQLAARDRLLATAAQAQQVEQHEARALQRGHAELDRPEPADLVLGRNEAALPGVTLAHPAVVDQRETLSLWILEVEARPAAALPNPAVLDTVLAQPGRPPVERVRAGDPEAGAANAVRTPALPL